MRMLILSVLLIAFTTATSEAGWLIYHMPALNGQILDIETKQPIEGAVVVVEYQKATMGLGAGSISSVINVSETLTDKNGNFHIPSYTTFIQPFSWQVPTIMIIYKPGYASLELGKDYFTGKETEEEEGSWPGPDFKGLKYRIHGLGIVEIPKLKTWEQRWKSMPSPVTDIDYKDQKLLIQLLNEENKNLGFKGQYNIKE